MKVFLDDLRTEPDGWLRVFWPDQASDLLKSGLVTDISLLGTITNSDAGAISLVTGAVTNVTEKTKCFLHHMTPLKNSVPTEPRTPNT